VGGTLAGPRAWREFPARGTLAGDREPGAEYRAALVGGTLAGPRAWREFRAALVGGTLAGDREPGADGM
jgi:hypothetical protein